MDKELMKEKTLQIIIKNVYGENKIYPACEKSKAFLNALGLKTFTKQAISAAKALGFEIQITSEFKGVL